MRPVGNFPVVEVAYRALLTQRTLHTIGTQLANVSAVLPFISRPGGLLLGGCRRTRLPGLGISNTC